MMDFPFGHHRRQEEEEDYPPPPPPPQHHHHHQGSPFPQPGGYPPVHHVSHEFNNPPDFINSSYPPPPPVHHVSHPDFINSSYPPPPPVHHVSHEFNNPPDFINSSYPAPPPQPHHEHHNIPSFIHHHTHGGSEFSNKPSVRVYSKAETGYSLTIRDGHVVLARSDPNDIFQHWIKDEKYSTRVKDEQGFPSFALVNKATGEAIKHSIGAEKPVQLIPYVPDRLDESILWSESKDLGDTYRTIRMVNNIRLNLDAFNGDKNHGGVHDGTKAVLWEWKKGDNQRWKIVPY